MESETATAETGKPLQNKAAHDVVIVGGGLSGLAAAAALAEQGISAPVLEARGRLGGRILSFTEGGADFDLGPSWIWPGQPCVADLVRAAGITVFPQYATGALVHQQADGRLERYPGFAPMGSALRIAGEPSALVTALAEKLPPGQVRLDHAVTALSLQDNQVHLSVTTPAGTSMIATRHVALAIPPRLAAGLAFTPALPRDLVSFLEATPTWMAGHAKFVAVYGEPFWRQQGLSGDVISRRGPLAEIHDISPPEGGPYALFGFLGLDAGQRQTMGEADLMTAARQQLVDIFGAAAEKPLALRLKDWSRAPFTATITDAAALAHHPAYGLPDFPLGPWASRLDFVATETDRENGGLIEGALARAQAFAASVAAGISAAACEQ